MIRKITCNITALKQSYEIEIQRDSLLSQSAYLRTLGSKFAIITDDLVAQLYGGVFLDSLVAAGLHAEMLVFPHGEINKTRKTKEYLEDKMLEKRFGRDTCVIALGGGVVTDVSGHLAATYCRGVPLVIIPTSLMAMVDASIGGKSAVNVPQGKNLIGSVYQPKKIVIDPSVLQSLPQSELCSGIVEMIKHGLIADAQAFEYLEGNIENLKHLDSQVFENLIDQSCSIKKEIVEIDPKETGKRRLLNFGHTVGHAIELLSDYAISHGEAVAMGILAESRLSVELGYLNESALGRIATLIKQCFPLQKEIQFSPQSLLDAMKMDKKSVQNRPRFVIIDEIGSAVDFDGNYCTEVNENLLKKVFENALCCN